MREGLTRWSGRAGRPSGASSTCGTGGTSRTVCARRAGRTGRPSGASSTCGTSYAGWAGRSGQANGASRTFGTGRTSRPSWTRRPLTTGGASRPRRPWRTRLMARVVGVRAITAVRRFSV